MKYKTTKKTLRDNYHYIIGVGYCDLQFLLKHRDANSYCTRVEGWACDNYDVDGTLISTGYAPLKDKNLVSTWDTIRIYEKKAEKICCDRELSYEEQKAKLEVLLKEFIAECKEVA